MKQLDILKKHLKQGEVYRRADLKKWSTAVDRHLQQFVNRQEPWKNCPVASLSLRNGAFSERLRHRKTNW